MRIRVEVSSLATPHRSGVSAYTKLLAEALSKQKDANVYAHYFNFLGRQPQPELTGNMQKEENSLVPLRVYAKLQSYGLAWPFDLFLQKVDLTILPNFATWPTAKSKLRATAIHDLTYLYFPELVETKNLKHLRRVVPRSINSADIILTVSEAVKGELIKEFHINPDRIVATPIPPDEMFKQKCDEQELAAVRQKYEIGDKKYLFFLGNFEPRKNLRTLITAYTLLPESIRNKYSLVLAGGKGWNSGETQQVLKGAIQNGSDIKHIGYIDDADRPALYQAASLFVFPSLYEGFGIPVLEAMLSGCPVVASDIAVLREAGGDAALYANPKDPDDLAKVIEKALDKFPYAESSMQKNVARFSWDKNVTAITDMVERLLNK